MENNILKLIGRDPITSLAEKSGVHRNSISAYVKGAAPRLDNAYKIANALGVSVYEIWPDITQKEE